VAVPIREADATVWLPQAEIQRILAAGWAATGGPSEEFLSSLIEQAVMAAQRQGPPSRSAAGIGEGEPGWKGMFHQAWNDLMSRRVWIGQPAGTLHRDGPGVVQHFESVQALFGWVLCALPHRRPVAVAGEIWQALQAVGAGASGGNALGAIGFPVPEPQATRVIRADATSVDLTGGQWGDGRLLRDADGEWHWEPAVRFDMNMTRAAANWTGPPEPQLRIRVVATLPWAGPRELAITPQRRRNLEQDLPASELAALVTTLSLRHGADLQAAGWQRGPHGNSLDRLSYSSVTTTLDGQIILTAEVMVALPGAMHSSVVTCAELRIEDLDAWVAAVAAASGTRTRQALRLSVEEIAEFLALAWHMATERLPAATTTASPGTIPWAAPPTVEFRLTAERPTGTTPDRQPALDEYLRLDPLGQTDRGQLREMAVTIIAPPILTQQARRTRTREALAYMAQHYGFLEATEDRL